MSKELADRLEAALNWNYMNGSDMTEAVKEAIAALRSEPVVHPTYGTLRQLVDELHAQLLKDEFPRIGQMGALYWFADNAASSREQDQRSEQSSELNGDVLSVSPSSSSSVPNGMERTGNSAQIDTVTGRRDGHPSRTDRQEPKFYCPACERDVTSPCYSPDCATPECDQWPTTEQDADELLREARDTLKHCTHDAIAVQIIKRIDAHLLCKEPK